MSMYTCNSNYFKCMTAKPGNLMSFKAFVTYSKMISIMIFYAILNLNHFNNS